MSLEILNIVPETLANEQHKSLRSATINKFLKIIELLKSGDYQKISEMTDYSPAGDGHGLDNTFISFNDIHSSLEDIGDVLSKLKSLKEISLKQLKSKI